MNVHPVIRGPRPVTEPATHANEEFAENHKEPVWFLSCRFGGLPSLRLRSAVVFSVSAFLHLLIHIAVVFKLSCYIFVIFRRIRYVDYCAPFPKSFWSTIISRPVLLFGVSACSLLLGSFCEFSPRTSDIRSNITRGIFPLIRSASIFVLVEHVIVNCQYPVDYAFHILLSVSWKVNTERLMDKRSRFFSLEY